MRRIKRFLRYLTTDTYEQSVNVSKNNAMNAIEEIKDAIKKHQL